MRKVKEKNEARGVLGVIRKLMDRNRFPGQFERRVSVNADDDSHIRYSLQPRKNDTFGKRGNG